MVTQHTFKTRVRARMAKTGESYTAARRMLISAGDAPEPQPIAWTPPVAEDRLVEATGRGWDAWLDHLDGVGARDWKHGAIAKRLTGIDGVDGWWAQSITVGYERARQGRKVGQMRDGFTISVSRTIGVPAETVFAAVTDPSVRGGWLPDAELRLRTATAPTSARFDWEDGATRLVVDIVPKDDRATITLAHEKLPDQDTADEMKPWWRDRLGALKALLEAPGRDGGT